MSNRLAGEASPYLQQHASNPVDWYPWSEEAFARAREANLPIHLSIGYAACHWCHVMAHESFEDPATAALLNERFVNIKVDRQERPDVDEVYQKVVQMMGEPGGWPLTVFLTHDGEPFFGGTYFPPQDRYGRPGLARLIVALSEAWKAQDRDLLSNIEAFRLGFLELDRRAFPPGSSSEPDLAQAAALALSAQIDPVQGGFKGAPKFPNPSCLDLMLRVFARTREAPLLEAVRCTLEGMRRGGIHDQLGGGFARYSVDEGWAVPHFEKMLYDNAQLVRLYADGYRLTGRAAWRRTFEQAVDYVLRDMTDAHGGFFASEDADSEGEEGRFYVWTPDEVRAVLGAEEAEFACRTLGIRTQGNFEGGRSVPSLTVDLDADGQARLDAARGALLAARERRVRPARDENVLAGWNGLMIQGLCAAFQATGGERYLDAARAAADFIAAQMTMPDAGVYRVWRNGSARIGGFLDDYAEMSNALIDLYECCFEARYLARATELADRMLAEFWDEGFYMTAVDGERLVHRPRALFDHAWPSGNSSAVFALVRLHAVNGSAVYRERAEQVFESLSGAAEANAFSFARLLVAMDFARQGPQSIVLAGAPADVRPLAQAAQRVYLPARVLALAEHVHDGAERVALNGRATAYVCRGQICQPPAVGPEALRQLLAAGTVVAEAT